MPKYIDIGANLVDTMFRGVYRGKQKHRDDLLDILSRAKTAGVKGMLVTAGNLEEAETAVKFCKEFSTDDLKLKCTVGVHPTRCLDFYKAKASHEHNHETPEDYSDALKSIIKDNPEVVESIGECGLDNDRLHFCDAENQKIGFKKQIPWNQELNLPLFLHNRDSTNDFISCFKDFSEIKSFTGVVHSFTGTQCFIS